MHITYRGDSQADLQAILDNTHARKPRDPLIVTLDNPIVITSPLSVRSYTTIRGGRIEAITDYQHDRLIEFSDAWTVNGATHCRWITIDSVVFSADDLNVQAIASPNDSTVVKWCSFTRLFAQGCSMIDLGDARTYHSQFGNLVSEANGRILRLSGTANTVGDIYKTQSGNGGILGVPYVELVGCRETYWGGGGTTFEGHGFDQSTQPANVLLRNCQSVMLPEIHFEESDFSGPAIWLDNCKGVGCPSLGIGYNKTAGFPPRTLKLTDTQGVRIGHLRVTDEAVIDCDSTSDIYVEQLTGINASQPLPQGVRCRERLIKGPGGSPWTIGPEQVTP